MSRRPSAIFFMRALLKDRPTFLKVSDDTLTHRDRQFCSHQLFNNAR
jgi:hypothetical protein